MNQAYANAFAESLRPAVSEIIATSRKYWTGKGLALELNRQGITTARGGAWHPTSALRLMRRLDELYLALPYFGSGKFAAVLGRECDNRSAGNVCNG